MKTNKEPGIGCQVASRKKAKPTHYSRCAGIYFEFKFDYAVTALHAEKHACHATAKHR